MAPSVDARGARTAPNVHTATVTKSSNPHQGWTAADSEELYALDGWARPWFKINSSGKLCIRSVAHEQDAEEDHAEAGVEVEVEAVVDELLRRGLQLPLSLHWDDILVYNARRLFAVWDHARAQHAYAPDYRGVFPFKVNCLNGVAPLLLAAQPRLGLEVGTLAELLVAIGVVPSDGPRRMLIVDGFKSDKFIEATLRAAQLPVFQPTILVYDRVADVAIHTRVAQRTGLPSPRLGVRARLAAKGAGKHASSTGAGSKFGMGADELLHVLDVLKNELHALDQLVLLHFHIGSQVSSIGALELAFREGAQLYCRLREVGAAHLDTIDVGGGLAIRYDNTRASDSSADYDWDTYATTAVRVFAQVTDAHGQPRPHIVTESGRALTAQHAMMVFDVEDTVSVEHGAVPRHRREEWARQDSSQLDAQDHSGLRQLATLAEGPTSASSSRADEDTHRDAIEAAYSEVQQDFARGALSLAQRGLADRLRQRALEQVVQTRTAAAAELGPTHQAMINMSLFQSLNHVWTLRSVFPSIPIQRLHERPEIRAVLTDLTCDSLGVVDKFQALHTSPRSGPSKQQQQPSRYLPMHRLLPPTEPSAGTGTGTGTATSTSPSPTLPTAPRTAPRTAQPYRIATCFTGAYNALLNGRHNLFGGTDSAGVALLPRRRSQGRDPAPGRQRGGGGGGGGGAEREAEKSFQICWTRAGDSVESMVRSIGYDAAELMRNVGKIVERGRSGPAPAPAPAPALPASSSSSSSSSSASAAEEETEEAPKWYADMLAGSTYPPSSAIGSQ